MKKSLSTAFMLCGLLLLGGCGPSGAAPTPAHTPSPAPTPEMTAPPAPTPVPEAVWTEQVYSHEFKADDGTTVMSVRYSLPAIANRFAAPEYETVDSWYTAEGEMLLQDAAEQAGWAVDDYLSAGAVQATFTPYTDVQSFEIKRRSSQWVSVLRTHVTGTGGDMLTAFLFTDLFDLTTGERRTLEQCFSVPKDQVIERVLREVLLLNAAGAYDGAPFPEEQMENGFDPTLFYFTEGGLVIPFQAYALGMRAVCIPDRSIPYSALEDMLSIW